MNENGGKQNNELTYIKGIGPRRSRVLQNHGITDLHALLHYYPRSYLDRSVVRRIADITVGDTVTLVGTVQAVSLERVSRGPILKVLIRDDSSILTLVWFKGVRWLQNAFENGDLLSVSGKVGFFKGLTMSHPDFDILADNRDALNTGRIIPVYPLTQALREAGFNSRSFRRIFSGLFIDRPHLVDEILPDHILAQHSLPGYDAALRQIHLPESAEALASAQRRFKFQEFFLFQLLLAIRRKWIRHQINNFKVDAAGDIIFKLVEDLPFELTAAQKKVVHEIYGDLKSDNVMNRLLQGDVGSGKTIVAALTASIMAANGFQTAIMAPTEILAEQHFSSFRELFEPLGVNSELLIGRQTKKKKDAVLKALAEGEIKIIIGTHALVQEQVAFRKLGLVIIDEQHRFGVDQRGLLMSKGMNPHMLAMTATPIPRTLSMSLYGDMDVSVIDSLPEGRQSILSRMVLPEKMDSVYDFIKSEVDKGRQAYIVYPLISESQKSDLQAAEEGFKYLSETVFSHLNVALLHSRTPVKDKERTMAEFKDGLVNILVSTTVIEVGVNVPNATVMLVENAERFGLTQLHQLRGRVGRGSEKSYCILVARQKTEQGLARLRILEKTADGFVISEEDLKMRGPGDYFSTRQHGEADFVLADPLADSGLMRNARKSAFNLIHADEQLLQSENRSLRQYFLKFHSDKLKYAGIS